MPVKIIIFAVLFLCACSSLPEKNGFEYKELRTEKFTLASWQKVNNPGGVYKIYIEGDGRSFTKSGLPSKNPTPVNTFFRKLAFGDKSPNVIYLARPCQYVKDAACGQEYWTNARFSKEVVASVFSALKQTAGGAPVILIGFSGGAQIAGLAACAFPELNVKKIITIAGNLDHPSWTIYHNLPPLNSSMDLNAYKTCFLSLKQTNYIGAQDKVIPPFITENFLGNSSCIVSVAGASHGKGFESIYADIWDQR